MARNGTGTFTKAVSDFTAGTTVSSSDMNTLIDDIGDEITNSVDKDGQTVYTGEHDWNGNKMIIDADGDSKIGSDTDDQFDIDLSGATSSTFAAGSQTVVPVANAYLQKLSATDSYLSVMGGTGNGTGGQIAFYGSTHSTAAYDIEFFSKGTGATVARYDFSALLWDFIEPTRVKDNTATYIFTVENHSSSAPDGILIDFSNLSPDDNTQEFLRCDDSTTTRCVIYSDGDLQNHDNSYGAISDEKLKADIVDARSYWDDFKSLKYRKFRFKSDIELYGKNCPTRIGLVAQEVESVFPSCVKETHEREVIVTEETVPAMEEVVVRGKVVKQQRRDKDNELVFEKQPKKELKPVLDDEGNPVITKGVKYSVIDGTINSIVLQEAMKRIESLEAQVAALSAQ